MIPRRLLRLPYLLGAVALMGGASIAATLPGSTTALSLPGDVTTPSVECGGGDISVLTYNVAGLPWPLAKKGPDALRAIGDRLSRMRAAGCAPNVVVLQETFSQQAKDIGRLSGYSHVVEGPDMRTGTAPRGVERDWLLGEASGTLVDSGLMILSDLPVLDVKRAAFPEGACAGYDCLAAKGVVLVTLRLPDGRAVSVATTHFNSKGASRAPALRTIAAYRQEADFTARFIARNRSAGAPVIVAGDFNQGPRPDRIAALQSAFDPLSGHPMVDTLRTCLAENAQRLARSADAQWIVRRARDLQFVFDGKAGRLDPIGASIPFGTERDGSMLSDHMGYTIRYRYSAT